MLDFRTRQTSRAGGPPHVGCTRLVTLRISCSFPPRDTPWWQQIQQFIFVFYYFSDLWYLQIIRICIVLSVFCFGTSLVLYLKVPFIVLLIWWTWVFYFLYIPVLQTGGNNVSALLTRLLYSCEMLQHCRCIFNATRHFMIHCNRSLPFPAIPLGTATT
jgi:hypothetical protein